MADFRAIHAVGGSILHLLRSSYRQEDFDGNELTFELYSSADFDQAMTAGVSVFLYRVQPNGQDRIPAGRVGPDGRRLKPQLPIDLHFLLTAWSNDASLQQTIAGWMMRALEDHPILPAGLLNATVPNCFREDETVDLSLSELRTEDLLRIWETMVDKKFQLSVPYVARIVRIESTETLTSGPPVQERQLQYHTSSRLPVAGS